MHKSRLLTKKTLLLAEKHLSSSDEIMATLISRHGSCRIAASKHPPFHTLASSIISQQLSAKAAATIKQRIAEIVSHPFMPENFKGVRRDRLRRSGLSNAKINFILDLSRHIIGGRLAFDSFSNMENEAVIAALTEIKGIGRWTAEMFLIFGLKRPDVMAVSDAGLRRAAKLLYGDKVTLDILAARWSPYCSVASWYLWQHLDAA